MPSSATAPVPFEKETALEADSPALSTAIYSDPLSTIDDTEIVKCPPRIVCSPRRTGKTTLVNHIVNKQRFISNLLQEEVCKTVVISVENGASEANLKEALALHLESPFGCETLTEFMERSDVITASAKDRVILVVPDADNLSIEALRWLLYNVREILDNSLLARTFSCQIIIDGSFTLENITTADSEFPLPQIFPRDFYEAEQLKFVEKRLAQLKINLSRGGFKALWGHTKGDKYLTQAICLNLVKSIELPTLEVLLTDRHVNAAVEVFTNAEPHVEPIKTDWISCFAEISDHFETQEFGLRSFLKDPSAEWKFQSEAVHRIAYQGGIVRRKAPMGLETRPFVLQTLENSLDRVVQARSILDSGFVLDGVPVEKSAEAKDLIGRIIKASYFDTLRTLHAGAARKLSSSLIEIEAFALEEGIYKGTWEVSTDPQIAIGDELWAVLWSWEGKLGQREGEIRTFPMKALV